MLLYWQSIFSYIICLSLRKQSSSDNYQILWNYVVLIIYIHIFGQYACTHESECLIIYYRNGR